MQNITPQKVCYFDVETTGTDPERHGIIQVAMIMEIAGKAVPGAQWLVRPHEGVEIDPRALEVNGHLMDEIQQYPAPDIVFGRIQRFLGGFVDKYERTDKLTPAGYNVKFDLDFLKSFWVRCGDEKYFGSWFNWDAVDPLALLRYLKFAGLLPPLPDLKLGTVCEHFGIALGEDAHDAMADIKATRELVHLLREIFLPPIIMVGGVPTIPEWREASMENVSLTPINTGPAQEHEGDYWEDSGVKFTRRPVRTDDLSGPVQEHEGG